MCTREHLATQSLDLMIMLDWLRWNHVSTFPHMQKNFACTHTYTSQEVNDYSMIYLRFHAVVLQVPRLMSGTRAPADSLKYHHFTLLVRFKFLNTVNSIVVVLKALCFVYMTVRC